MTTPWRCARLLSFGVSNALQRVYYFIVFSFPLHSELWASLTSANDVGTERSEAEKLEQSASTGRGKADNS